MSAATPSTADRIAHVLRDHFGIVDSCITPGTRLNELGFESLDWADFWFDLETECQVEIDEANPILEKAGMLGELAAAIDNIKAQRAA